MNIEKEIQQDLKQIQDDIQQCIADTIAAKMIAEELNAMITERYVYLLTQKQDKLLAIQKSGVSVFQVNKENE